MATVLIVEDDATIRKFLSINLSARGYNVVEADNARDGLSRVRDSNPDLVLLDIRMPEMSGLDMLRIMNNDPQTARVPVVIVTASHLNLAGEKTLAKNVVDVLIKPIPATQLVQAVSDAVSHVHH